MRSDRRAAGLPGLPGAGSAPRGRRAVASTIYHCILSILLVLLVVVAVVVEVVVVVLVVIVVIVIVIVIVIVPLRVAPRALHLLISDLAAASSSSGTRTPCSCYRRRDRHSCTVTGCDHVVIEAAPASPLPS